MSERKQFDGYIRVSSLGGRDPQGADFYSPADQRRDISKWAELRRVDIARWHEDLDRSGTGGEEKRPGLAAVMTRVRARETDGVAVAYLSRLSRQGVADALRIVQEIHDAGGELAAVDLGVDPTTPFGEFGMTLMLALNRMEIRRIGASWSSSRRNAVERGINIGATPYGMRQPHNERGKRMPLEVDLERAWIVQGAYAAAAHGIDAVVEFLREADPTRPWSAWKARRLLGSRAYVGEAGHGEFTKANAHPALVSEAEWTLGQHPSEGARRNVAAHPLAGGTVLCAGCDEPLRATRLGKNRRGLRCNANERKGGPSCPAPAIALADPLERLLEAKLLAVPPRRGRGRDPAARIMAAEDALERAERALVKIAGDLALERRIGPDPWRAAVGARADARDRAREKLSEAMRAEGLPVQEASDLASRCEAVWSTIKLRKGRGDLEQRLILERR